MFLRRLPLLESSSDLRKRLNTLKGTYERLRDESSKLENQKCPLSFGNASDVPDILKQNIHENSTADDSEIARLKQQLAAKTKQLREIETKVAYKIIERNQLLEERSL